MKKQTPIRASMLILLLLLCYSCLSYAQTFCEGQVIDKATLQPIPQVTVKLIKQALITITNKQGYFKIITNTPMAGDTIAFSSIGYQTLKISGADIKEKLFIELQTSTTELKEVAIAGRNKSKTLERFSNLELWDYKFKPYSSTNSPLYFMTSFAKLFTAPTDNAVLTNVQIGRRDNEDGTSWPNKYTRFKLNVLKANGPNGMPGDVFFTREILLEDNSLRITVDLSQDNIVLPGKYFFVAIEWIREPFNEITKSNSYYSYQKAGKAQVYSAGYYTVIYQPLLAIYEKIALSTKKAPDLIKTGGIWKRFPYTEHEVGLSATVNY